MKGSARFVAIALLSVVATLLAVDGLERVSWLGSRGKKTSFILRTRCISQHVKSSNPHFFREGAVITGAKVVRHNRDAKDFFSWNEGLPMSPVTTKDTGWEWDWETGRFKLETSDVNWEWGFALENNFGEHLYEVGSVGSPLFKLSTRTCRAVVKYGRFFNRLLASDKGYGSKISYVFGSCRSQCPEIPFVEWSAEDRNMETQRVLEDTPNELGSEFAMYGTAGKGVCQFDIFIAGDNGNPDDPYSRNRLLHFLPADSRGDVHTNSKKHPGLWTGEVYWLKDNKKYWPSQFGPTNDGSSTMQWRVRMVLKETYVEISACDDWTDDSKCEVKSKDPYFSGTSYRDINGEGMTSGYDTNYIAGQCDFYAIRAGPKKNLNY